MSKPDRREFLGQLGVGMLATSVGWAVASELDLLGVAYAGESDRLDFGKLEPLVSR